MRVTILSKEFPPQRSGIGDHTDMLATELARRGITVSVVCSEPAERRTAFDVRPVIERWHGGAVDRIAREVALTEPHVVLWQYNPFSIGRRGIAPRAGGLARALSSHASLVLFCHELWFPWGREGARGLVWAVAQRAQGMLVLRHASRWIVTTERRERQLRRLGAGKVARIPVGTNIEPDGDPNGVRERLGIAPDAFVLAHLGSAGPGRDLRPVVSAITRLRAQGTDAHLILAGNTGPLPQPSPEGVHAPGFMPRAELSGLLKASDVYIHADPVGPSAGRRTTLVAAMAHGLPIVAYRGPDTASELSEGQNVLFVPRDAVAIAGVMRELVAAPDRRRALGDAARETYEKNFSWTRIGDAVLGVLQDRR